MANRNLNIEEIMQKKWDNLNKLALIWLIGDAKNFGVNRVRVAAMSEDLNCGISTARKAIDFLIAKKDEKGELHGPLLTWQSDGAEFYILRKWGNYQHISYFQKPNFTEIPRGIFEETTEETRSIFRKFSERLPEKLRSVVVDVDVDVVVDDPPSPPGDKGCGWCLRPKENQEEDYNLVLFHHREFKQRFNECPNTNRAVGRNRKELKELLKLHTAAEIQAIFVYALDCPASWVKTLSGIISKFDELDLDKKKGIQYGASSNRKAGQPIRRHDAAPPEAFGRSGKVNL